MSEMAEKMSMAEFLAEELKERQRTARNADGSLASRMASMERSLAMMKDAVDQGFHVADQVSQDALRLVEEVTAREKAWEEVRRAEWAIKMFEEGTQS